jgi:hypothetical protein
MDSLARVQTVAPAGESAAPDLSNLPGFAAGDVAANLEGRPSDAQTSSLWEQVRNRGIGVAAVVAVAIFNWANGVDVLWLAILAIAITVAVYRFATAIADLTNPVVKAIEGDVLIESDSEGSKSLRVGDKKFSLSGKASKALISGGPYRVYFLERANLLVGAQVLPGWRSSAPAAKKRFPFSIGIG